MKRSRPNLFWGALLILIGGFFLAMNMGLISELSEVLWGIAFAVAGLLFFAGYLSRGKQNWGLLFPVALCEAIALTFWLTSAGVDENVIGGLFMIAISIPFWAGYVTNRQRNWGALIPGWIIGIIGLIVLLAGEGKDELIGALVVFAIALPFFVVYFTNRTRWWALIPGWVMGVLGIIVLFDNMLDGDLIGALFMFATALPFFVVFAVNRQRWWALIPAGVLSTIGVTVLLSMFNHSEAVEVRVLGGALFAGIGVTFAALWLLRHDQDTDWAKYPAVGLGGAAALIIVSGASFEYVWPVILIGTGMWLLLNRSSQPKEKSFPEGH
jgi:hypothetical protein